MGYLATFVVACRCSFDEALQAGAASDVAALEVVRCSAVIAAVTAYDEDGFVIGEFESD